MANWTLAATPIAKHAVCPVLTPQKELSDGLLFQEFYNFSVRSGSYESIENFVRDGSRHVRCCLRWAARKSVRSEHTRRGKRREAKR